MSPLRREIYALLLGRKVRGRWWQRVLPVSAASHLPSAQNNLYCQSGIFLRVAYSDYLN